MSAWTEVKGTVFIRKDSGFSFKTYIDENFMEAVPKIWQKQALHGDNIKVEFSFCFSDSNLQAAKSLQSFVDIIKEHDKNAYVDIYSNLRFLG